MPRALRELALALALFALALGVSHATRERAHERELASDEPEWIAISILHWNQLVHGAPPAGAEIATGRERSENPWRQGVQDTTFGYMNPALPKLVWGAALAARDFDEASPRVFEVLSRDDPAGKERARAALEPAAPAARAVVVALSAACAVLLVFIARALRPGWPGVFAGAAAFALWFASPLVQATSSYLRTDFFMLPFCLAALLIALHMRASLASTRGTRALALAALALGVACGLAVSSKLNGALLCFAFALWCAVLWLHAPRTERASFVRGPLLAALVAGAVCCALFVALNPRLWSEPIDGVRDMLARWEKLMAFFTDTWGPAQGFEVPHSTWQRVELFARKTFTRDDALGVHLHPLIGAGACLAGLALLAKRCRDQRAMLVLLFVLVFVLGTALWLPLDWARFYLTATPCIVLLQATLVAELAALIGRRRNA